VKAKLRFISLRWPGRSEALKRAGKERGLYQCEMCKDLFKTNNIILDHIEPVVPLVNDWKYMEIDWNIYIPRLFCQPEGFRVLCKACDEAHTAIQDSMRKRLRDIKKDKERVDKKQRKE